MRTSSYNILTRVDEQEGLYAILNAYTQAFDIVNTEVYNYLRVNGENNKITEETRDTLVKRGYLTSLSQKDELELVKQLLDRAYDEARLKKNSFHFILSYDCNLRCVYCYEDPVLNGSMCLPKRQITKEQVDKAFEIIIEKNANGTNNKKIALYGGEPFLAENYDILIYIVEKGKGLGYSFSVTSNGYDIDKYLDYIKDNKVFSFQITLDGIAEIHNKRKPHYKNEDSFEKISANIDSLLKLGIPVTVRINTDTYTMEYIDQLLEFFKEKGWCKYKHFMAYCALLRKEITKKEDGLPSPKAIFIQSDFCRSYYNKKLFVLSEGKLKCQDYDTSDMLKSLLQGKFLPYKGCFCGAQSAMIIFDPLGDVYSCWDVVGIREQRVGRYMPEFELDEELSKRWFDVRISEYKCVKCKYVLFCGGGCPSFSFRDKGKVEPGTCNDYPKLFTFLMRQVYNDYLKNSWRE